MRNRRSFFGTAGGLVVAAAASQLVAPATAQAAQAGWIECPACRGLWWPDRGGQSACPVPGHTNHSRALGGDIRYTVKMAADGGPGQNDWRSCAACQSLWWAGTTAGRCAGDANGHRISSTTISKSFYYLMEQAAEIPGGVRHRSDWHSCDNCSSLFRSYNREPAGSCPANEDGWGPHKATRSFTYALRY